MRVLDERLAIILQEDEQRFDKKTAPFLNDCSQLFVLWKQLIERLYPELAPTMLALAESEQPPSELRSLPAVDLYQITHALSTLFQLYNLAEEHHRLRRIGAHRSKKPENGTFAALASQEPLLDELRQVNVRIVFTAHPTEVRRPALLREWRKIAGLLVDSERADITPTQHQLLRDELETAVQTLLITGDVRTNEVTPYHEIRDLWAQLSNVWSASELLFHRIRSTIPGFTDSPHRLQPLSFGCWVGSDADGNPNITPETMQYAAETLRRMALSRYLTTCETLRSRMTASAGLLNFSPEVHRWISSIEKRMPQTSAQLGRRYREEPFRRALTLICERLRDTLQLLPEDESLHGYEIVRTIPPREIEYPYSSAAELETDLAELSSHIRKTLRTSDWQLEQFLFTVGTFGFHYASLEHRLHAKDVLDSFRKIWQIDGNDPINDERLYRKIRETVQCGEAIPLERIDDTPTIKRLQKAAELRRIFGAQSLDTIILSGTSRIEELLGLSLLVDACDVDSTAAEPVRIVPLFETLDDLKHAPVFLEELFSLPYWRRKLDAAHNVQEVMLGYSDSGKDAGIVAANLALDRAAREIQQAGIRNNVSIQFFHGRGGTVARGGGFLYQSIAASPHGVGDGHWKLTEQGEMIATRYGDPALAVRIFEQMIVATVESKNRQRADVPLSIHIGEFLSTQSERAWRDLVYRDPDFAKFFTIASPIVELSTLRIGSRPAKRTPGGDITALRAIPWNFAWLQNRINLTGWYGAGAMLTAMKSDRELWNRFTTELTNSPMLQLLFQKIQVSLWLSDWVAAERYLNRVPNDLQKFVTTIRDEFQSLQSHLDELQQYVPAKAYSIFQASHSARKAPLRGLAAIQNELIERFRNQSGDTVEVMLQRSLLQTFIGISAGLRNTG